jgi:hypothetical protein
LSSPDGPPLAVHTEMCQLNFTSFHCHLMQFGLNMCWMACLMRCNLPYHFWHAGWHLLGIQSDIHNLGMRFPSTLPLPSPKHPGLTWTIVRPGGLSNEPPAEVGNLVVGKEDTLFGLPDDPGRAVSRDTVSDQRFVSEGHAQRVLAKVRHKASGPDGFV